MTEFEPGLEEVGDQLRSGRPIPSAGFRAELRSQLLASGRRRPMPRGRLRLLIAANAVSGAVLLAVVAVGVAGARPVRGLAPLAPPKRRPQLALDAVGIGAQAPPRDPHRVQSDGEQGSVAGPVSLERHWVPVVGA